MTTESTAAGLRDLRARRAVRRLAAPARRAAALLPETLRQGYWAEFGLIAAMLLGLIATRDGLSPWESQDYTQFLRPWFEYLQVHGFHGLRDDFANYNMPYLYLLYLGTLLTPDALVAVKTIGAISDLALALGCVALLLRTGLRRELAVAGGAAVLILPEVLLNSAAWGQADSTYTALLAWSLWAATGGRDRAAWVLYALAFTFKLQAAFVLPAVLILQVTRRWSWRGPALAILTVLITEIPALVAGRSPASLASIYLDQANQSAAITMNAPSLYALMPDWPPVRAGGMPFALACVALLSYLVLRAARRRPLDPSAVLLLVAALAVLAPFTLPTMHERYFYVGNVLLFVYALVRRRMLPWAIVAQVIAVSAYSPFLLARDPVVPMGVLAIAQASVVLVVIRELLRTTGAFTALPGVRPATAGEAT